MTLDVRQLQRASDRQVFSPGQPAALRGEVYTIARTDHEGQQVELRDDRGDRFTVDADQIERPGRPAIPHQPDLDIGHPVAAVLRSEAERPQRFAAPRGEGFARRPRDADADGFIYDGTPRQRPALPEEMFAKPLGDMSDEELVATARSAHGRTPANGADLLNAEMERRKGSPLAPDEKVRPQAGQPVERGGEGEKPIAEEPPKPDAPEPEIEDGGAEARDVSVVDLKSLKTGEELKDRATGVTFRKKGSKVEIVGKENAGTFTPPQATKYALQLKRMGRTGESDAPMDPGGPIGRERGKQGAADALLARQERERAATPTEPNSPLGSFELQISNEGPDAAGGYSVEALEEYVSSYDAKTSERADGSRPKLSEQQQRAYDAAEAALAAVPSTRDPEVADSFQPTDSERAIRNALERAQPGDAIGVGDAIAVKTPGLLAERYGRGWEVTVGDEVLVEATDEDGVLRVLEEEGHLQPEAPEDPRLGPDAPEDPRLAPGPPQGSAAGDDPRLGPGEHDVAGDSPDMRRNPSVPEDEPGPPTTVTPGHGAADEPTPAFILSDDKLTEEIDRLRASGEDEQRLTELEDSAESRGLALNPDRRRGPSDPMIASEPPEEEGGDPDFAMTGEPDLVYRVLEDEDREIANRFADGGLKALTADELDLAHRRVETAELSEGNEDVLDQTLEDLERAAAAKRAMAPSDLPDDSTGDPDEVSARLDRQAMEANVHEEAQRLVDTEGDAPPPASVDVGDGVSIERTPDGTFRVRSEADESGQYGGERDGLDEAIAEATDAREDAQIDRGTSDASKSLSADEVSALDDEAIAIPDPTYTDDTLELIRAERERRAEERRAGDQPGEGRRSGGPTGRPSSEQSRTTSLRLRNRLEREIENEGDPTLRARLQSIYEDAFGAPYGGSGGTLLAGEPGDLFKQFSKERRIELAREGKAIPRKNSDGKIIDGSYPIDTEADLSNAIQAVGRAAEGERAEVRRHIRKRARALGKTDAIPDTWSMGYLDEDDREFFAAAGGEAFNWVEDVGGLPSYITRIEKHLRKKGMTESHAIATAVNAVKRMCATGDTNFPGKQQVNIGSQAEACEAVADWERKRAQAHAMHEDAGGEIFHTELPEASELFTADDSTPVEIPILRTGKYVRGGVDKSISEADLERAVENFNADLAEGIELPIDYDHSFAEGRGSRAAGWYRGMRKQGSELLAKVEWTKPAREAIANDEYKYFSSEFHRDHALEDGTKRGFSVVSGGVTNRPFLRRLGTVRI